MMTLGLVIGEFLPYHRGHDRLIRWAKTQVDQMIVLVGYKTFHKISGEVRASWISELHPDIEVIVTPDDLPERPEPWAVRTLTVLNGRKPDIVFSSENYGEYYAELMGAQHRLFDLERYGVSVSGTLVRNNVDKHWSMLTPPAKAYLCKRICVVGTDSSGTSTLALDLANHYDTVCVPEYGRLLYEHKHGLGTESSWQTSEFVQIADVQNRLEEAVARQARNGIIICDTDSLATHVWHWRYLLDYSSEVEALADELKREFSLTILTKPDFGFVQDGTRDEDEARRIAMHYEFISVLERKGRPYIEVSGTFDQRLKTSVEKIDDLLVFDRIVRR